MAKLEVKITGRQVLPNGHVAITFNTVLDGVDQGDLGLDFTSLAEMKSQVEKLVPDWVQQNTGAYIMLAWWLARDATLSNVNQVISKDITLDTAANNVIVVR